MTISSILSIKMYKLSRRLMISFVSFICFLTSVMKLSKFDVYLKWISLSVLSFMYLLSSTLNNLRKFDFLLARVQLIRIKLVLFQSRTDRILEVFPDAFCPQSRNETLALTKRVKTAVLGSIIAGLLFIILNLICARSYKLSILLRDQQYKNEWSSIVVKSQQ